LTLAEFFPHSASKFGQAMDVSAALLVDFGANRANVVDRRWAKAIANAFRKICCFTQGSISCSKISGRVMRGASVFFEGHLHEVCLNMSRKQPESILNLNESLESIIPVADNGMDNLKVYFRDRRP
jgi:hypothetical protein